MHHQPAVASSLVVLSFACAGGPPESPSPPVPAAASPATVARARADELGEVVEEMSDGLWVVFHDRNGAHWFGSDGQGVYRVDGETIVRYSTADGLCNDHIRQILEDGSGNLFFKTCGGISKFDGRRFSTLVPIESSTSASEWRSEPGDLWFLGDNGPYRYDGTSLFHLEFPRIALEDEFDAKFPAVPYSPYDIYSIRRDSRGALWFGTACFGICRYDGRSFTWITEDELTELDDGPATGIRGIVEDRDGKFWLNSLVYRYDAYLDGASEDAATAAGYRKERGIAADEGEAPYAYFMSGLTDDQGVSWIATYAAGVWRCDGEELTHFPVVADGRPITLFSIYRDHDDVLWLGTQAAGAWRFDGKSFERFRP